jgi:hypothetical protein
MELRVAAVMLTVTVAVPVKPPELAEIVAEPLVTPVATPAALTVTSLAFEELQVAVAVKSCVDPSE